MVGPLAGVPGLGLQSELSSIVHRPHLQQQQRRQFEAVAGHSRLGALLLSPLVQVSCVRSLERAVWRSMPLGF